VAATCARWLTALAGGLLVLALGLPGAYRERAFSIFDPGTRGTGSGSICGRPERGWCATTPGPASGYKICTRSTRRQIPRAIEPAGHLHSVYVQVAATMGVIGLAALVFLVAGLMRAASRGFATPAGPERAGASGRRCRSVSRPRSLAFLSPAMEWNFGDEELLDLLYVSWAVAFAAAAWPRALKRGARCRGRPNPTERLPDQPFGAIGIGA